ncbi:hypothetical protein H9P43_002412 [Blastocladiella emersonii ATCC 22665]|nr:hypothetical protein H9P43_002412 [Blastocladiella emersonii ATCC 22665]
MAHKSSSAWSMPDPPRQPPLITVGDDGEENDSSRNSRDFGLAIPKITMTSSSRPESLMSMSALDEEESASSASSTAQILMPKTGEDNDVFATAASLNHTHSPAMGSRAPSPSPVNGGSAIGSAVGSANVGPTRMHFTNSDSEDDDTPNSSLGSLSDMVGWRVANSQGPPSSQAMESRSSGTAPGSLAGSVTILSPPGAAATSTLSRNHERIVSQLAQHSVAPPKRGSVPVSSHNVSATPPVGSLPANVALAIKAVAARSMMRLNEPETAAIDALDEPEPEPEPPEPIVVHRREPEATGSLDLEKGRTRRSNSEAGGANSLKHSNASIEVGRRTVHHTLTRGSAAVPPHIARTSGPASAHGSSASVGGGGHGGPGAGAGGGGTSAPHHPPLMHGPSALRETFSADLASFRDDAGSVTSSGTHEKSAGDVRSVSTNASAGHGTAGASAGPGGASTPSSAQSAPHPAAHPQHQQAPPPQQQQQQQPPPAAGMTRSPSTGSAPAANENATSPTGGVDQETDNLVDQNYDPATPAPSFLQRLTGPIRERIFNYTRHLLLEPDAFEWRMWDRIMWLVDIYYLIIIPVAFAFMCEFGSDFVLHFFLFDVLYFMRIAANLIRPKIDKYGQLVLSTIEKRRFYFNNMHGWAEVIGAIPLDWIIIFLARSQGPLADTLKCYNPYYVYSDGTFSKKPVAGLQFVSLRYSYHMNEISDELIAYSVLRFIRLIGTVGTISWALKVHLPGMSSPISRLCKNLILSLYVTHLDSCGWWFVNTTIMEHTRWMDERYIAKEKYTGMPTSLTYRYFYNFFVTQRSLFFIPRETLCFAEAVYQIVEAMFAACVYGSILGNLSQIVRSFDSQAALDKVAKLRNLRRNFMSKYMIKQEFPTELQKKVLDQEEFEWIHKRGMDTENAFNQLPKSIYLEVCVHLYYELISSVPIFQTADDVFKVALCERVTMISVRKGFYICKAGDVGTEMYFIRSGSVDIMPKDESKVFTTLNQGAFFGEIALFQESRRTATARTAMDTELCVLKKDDFNDILSQYPTVREVFRAVINERQERDARRKAEEEEKARKEADATSKRLSADIRNSRKKSSLLTPSLMSGGRSGLMAPLSSILHRGQSEVVRSQTSVNSNVSRASSMASNQMLSPDGRTGSGSSQGASSLHPHGQDPPNQ